MKHLGHIIDAAQRFTKAGRARRAVDIVTVHNIKWPPPASPLPFTGSPSAWARYCIETGDSFRTYTLGFELLTIGDAATQAAWLQRGFAALAEHVGKL